MTNTEMAVLLRMIAKELESSRDTVPPVATEPVAGVTKWAAVRGKKGRIPRFVQDQTGLKTKYEVVSAYGLGAVFVAGEAPPSKI